MEYPTTFASITTPMTVIDMINRAAAAQGSMAYAAAASHADYNGHHVTVSFKPHAVSGPCWNAEYWWAGRVVLARGTFENCLRAGLQEQARGAKGGKLVVCVENEEQAQMCRDAGLLPEDEVKVLDAANVTPLHKKVGEAREHERYGVPAVSFLANSTTVEEYEAKLNAFLAERKARWTLQAPPAVEKPRMHKFEAAGLGEAPYKYVGMTIETYQACPGAPVQVGTCCDYCGTGIKETHWLVSKDGKRFKVGCDCIYKAGDKNLTRVVKTEVAKQNREKIQKRFEIRLAGTMALLQHDEVIKALVGMPHPRFEGSTLLNWVGWMLKNAGRTGKTEVCKTVERVAKAVIK